MNASLHKWMRAWHRCICIWFSKYFHEKWFRICNWSFASLAALLCRAVTLQAKFLLQIVLVLLKFWPRFIELSGKRKCVCVCLLWLVIRYGWWQIINSNRESVQTQSKHQHLYSKNIRKETCVELLWRVVGLLIWGLFVRQKISEVVLNKTFFAFSSHHSTPITYRDAWFPSGYKNA